MQRLTITLLLFFVGAAMTQPTEAATIAAASCSRTDVGNAVASAAAGDTVSIPAGTCNWTTTLAITKGITLLGAGAGSTILQDNVAKGGATCSGGGPLMDWSVSAPQTLRISGFTIQGVATDPGVCQRGHLLVSGSAKGIRIDHVTISPAQTAAIFVFGDITGVIDHLTFDASFKNAVVVEAPNWKGVGDWGDNSWAQPIQWGTDQAIYIEDSTFTDNSGGSIVGNFVDCYAGGRLVFRHNTAIRGNLTSHGADSTQRTRGCRQQEIYSNTFTFSAAQGVAFVTWIRGGTGVVFNNTITAPGGLNKVVQAANCRDAGVGCAGGSSSFLPWGACNGTSPYDQNVSGGYRCVDQPGSGTSNLLGGDPPSPVAWVGNALDAIYAWNNTVGGSSNNTVTGSANVVNNRDYFMGTARPGYAPYAYPHPLASGTSTSPSAPKNLRIMP